MINSPAYLKSVYLLSKSLGEVAVSSDATMVIKGYEEMTPLIKQFPMPFLSSTGEIEIALPAGSGRFQPQQIKTHQQGSVTLYETVDGKVAQFMRKINAGTGKFDAHIYEGLPSIGDIKAGLWRAKHTIYDCFFQLDNPDRDFENRGQAVTVSGTMFFEFFGESEFK